MTTIHGFLFSALGFSFGKSLSIVFFVTIGSIGILISFSTWLALDRATTAINDYVHKYQDKPKDTKAKPANINVLLAGFSENIKEFLNEKYRFLFPDRSNSSESKQKQTNQTQQEPESFIIGFWDLKKSHPVQKFFSPPNFLPIIFGFGWLAITGFSCFGNLDPTIRKDIFNQPNPEPPTTQIKILPK